MARHTYLIVGGGMAGARTARALRDLGCDDRIVLAGAEPEVRAGPAPLLPLQRGSPPSAVPRYRWGPSRERSAGESRSAAVFAWCQ